MSRWLVGSFEQQHVHAAHQHLGQQHAQLETARQRGQRRAMVARRDCQAFQHLAGARLQGVAVVRGDEIFKIRHASGVHVATRSHHAPLLGERVPHHPIATHGQIQDDFAVVEEAILPEHADAGARGDGHRSRRGLLVSGQNLQEGRLARAIRAHEAVASTGAKLQRHVREQHAGAVFLGEIRSGDHGSMVRGCGRAARVRYAMSTRKSNPLSP